MTQYQCPMCRSKLVKVAVMVEAMLLQALPDTLSREDLIARGNP